MTRYAAEVVLTRNASGETTYPSATKIVNAVIPDFLGASIGTMNDNGNPAICRMVSKLLEKTVDTPCYSRF